MDVELLQAIGRGAECCEFAAVPRSRRSQSARTPRTGPSASRAWGSTCFLPVAHRLLTGALIYCILQRSGAGPRLHVVSSPLKPTLRHEGGFPVGEVAGGWPQRSPDPPGVDGGARSCARDASLNLFARSFSDRAANLSRPTGLDGNGHHWQAITGTTERS